MRSLKGSKAALCIMVAIGFVLAFVAPSGATPEEHLEMLYKAAKAEGEVIWQTPHSAKSMDPAADAFRKKYPDIKLSVVSIGATAIPTRIIAEAGAKRISVDVGMALLAYMLPVVERDLLIKYDWVKAMDVDPRKVSYDNRFVTYGHSPRVWVRNTKRVSNEEAPKSLQDVLDPKWKGGKIAVRAAPSGFAWLWPLWKKDKEKVTAFLEGLYKQDVNPGKRDAMVAQQIGTGEFPIGTISASNAISDIKQGAPIAIMSLGQSASDPQMIFIPKGVPHPNAALLFMAWLVSKEGVKGMLDSGYGPFVPSDASPMAKFLADNGVTIVSIESPEDVKEYEGPFTDAVMKIMKFMPE